MEKKILISALMVAVFLAGCLQQQEEETIKIGAILPLTGKVSYMGEYMKEGTELAKDEINSEGGIKGRMLEIVYEDTQGDTKQGVTSYQKLVETEGLTILLSSISGVTLAVAPLAEEDKVVVFAIATAAPKISEAGDYIFRHNLLPQTEANVLADLIYNKKGIKEIGLLVVNTESGVSYRDEFKNAFEGLEGEIKVIEMYERDNTDYRTYLAKIKAAGVKAAFAASYTKELGFILKQSKELGLDIQWFSLYPAEGPTLLEAAGDAAEGLIYTHFFSPELPLVEGYQEKYGDRYGKSSESYAALAYDNVRILAEAMRKCSNPEDATCVKNELYKIKNFLSITGTVTFDKNGDTHKEIIIKTVKGGEFVLYEGS